ncbi:hypothetical protein JW758_04465 [Candidatus Peregrinibacteria bacterium]|nr:hypothetical protein [Candidatus Peregrinibacteria bacterium]
MTPVNNSNPETAPKKPTALESVDSFIGKQKERQRSEGEKAVQQSAEGVKGEVADVMGVVDKPKEVISERKGESGEGGDIKGGGKKRDDDDAQQIASQLRNITLPTEEVMIKMVRTAIQIQIKHEMKKAKKLEKNLATGSAQEYNTTIAKIRSLKEVLSSLLHATYSFVKGVYSKYFTPQGKRRDISDL